MEKQTKILHILNELQFSGAEIMLNDALPYFKRAGFEAHILCTGTRLGEYMPILKNNGYFIEHIPFGSTLHFLLSIHRYFKENSFDIIHIHTERANFWYAMLAKLSGTGRIVRTIHNCFEFTGLLRFRRLVQRLIMRGVFNVSFIFISNSVECTEVKNFKNEGIRINNWIDRGRFYPAMNCDERIVARRKYGIDEDAFVLTSIGSCHRVKNHKAIVEAICQLQNEIPNVCYVHVGTGEMEKEELQYGLDQRVGSHLHFLGLTTNVRDVLIASDLYVMPSQYEGLPIALLESLGTQIPVVAYNVKGINSVIQNGVNGMLCEPRSDALSETVLYLYRNPIVRDVLAKNGLEFVAKYHSIEAIMRQLFIVYMH